MKFLLYGGPFHGEIIDFKDPENNWGGSPEEESGEKELLQIGVGDKKSIYKRFLVKDDEVYYSLDLEQTKSLRR